MAEKCPCFYYDRDEDAAGEETCYCGHVFDEHDSTWSCTVTMDDLDATGGSDG